MPIKRAARPAIVTLIIIGGVLSLLYSLYGTVMSFFFIGNSVVSSWGDLYGFVFAHLPLLALPVYLTVFLSLNICRWCFTGYVLVDFLFGLVVFFRGLGFTKFFIVPKLSVILAALLLNSAYFLSKSGITDEAEVTVNLE